MYIYIYICTYIYVYIYIYLGLPSMKSNEEGDPQVPREVYARGHLRHELWAHRHGEPGRGQCAGAGWFELGRKDRIRSGDEDGGAGAMISFGDDTYECIYKYILWIYIYIIYVLGMIIIHEPGTPMTHSKGVRVSIVYGHIMSRPECCHHYPLVNNIAIENGHRNSEFSH